jgi:hemerythrin-like domain-containing protein
MIPVSLGGKPLADFTQPIEMMRDCHRRIEHFLDALRTVIVRPGEGNLTDEGRRALETALRYFKDFAPRHVADEEQSLFPRMRSSADANVKEALLELDGLECDHRRGESLHTTVERLGRLWLKSGHLDQSQRERLRAAIDELAAMYAGHIHLEEQRVFALASELLNAQQLREIGNEMKRRRGLNGPTIGVP